jgi:hypothetical protein
MTRDLQAVPKAPLIASLPSCLQLSAASAGISHPLRAELDRALEAERSLSSGLAAATAHGRQLDQRVKTLTREIIQSNANAARMDAQAAAAVCEAKVARDGLCTVTLDMKILQKTYLKQVHDNMDLESDKGHLERANRGLEAENDRLREAAQVLQGAS